MSSSSGAPSSDVVRSKLPAPRVERYKQGLWNFECTKSHILGSKCSTPVTCQVEGATETELCDLCRYDKIFGDVPLPDMIFCNNHLRIEYGGKLIVEFSALAALQGIRKQDDDNIQVAHAKAWKEARKDCQHTQNVKEGYDWTFTTLYTGTMSDELKKTGGSEKIDINKLKTKEPIRFFQELYLYEDELDDNGATNCVVKIRCMDSGFLVLFRHYLRVDHVLVRVRETRIYHDSSTSCIIRERITKKKLLDQLDVPSSVYKCPDQVSPHLDVEEEIVENFILPET